MKKRLCKKKKRKEIYLLPADFSARRRLDARGSLDRTQGVLGIQLGKISFEVIEEELIKPMPQALRDAYLNGEWSIT